MKKTVLFVLVLFINFSVFAQMGAEENILFEEIQFDITTVTASKIEQQLTDAPAVLTVITRERIRELGAKTLLDVLRTVAGFNVIQDTNEHLVVIRSIYASTNQKFLILKDGHTLNDAMFRTIEFDYSIALDDIEKIEIIRGPGSTVYGSAALTGVINLISRKGENINGTEFSVTVGKYGEKRASAVYGERKDDLDIVLHAAWYDNEGEEKDQPASLDLGTNRVNGEQVVDRYNRNYDVGLKLSQGNFTLSGSVRRSEYLPPRTNGGALFDEGGTVRDANQVFEWKYVELNYESELADDLVLKLTHFYDQERWFSNQFLNPERDYMPFGKWLYMEFETGQFGLEYSATKTFQSGNIGVGIRAHTWEVFSDRYIHNIADPNVFAEGQPLLNGEDGEYYYAAYFLIDKSFTSWLKFHFSASYDEYELTDSSFNPRAALIVKPTENFSWKILYGKAFLNPAFFYRYITPDAFGYFGGPDLKPEEMESFQTHFFYQIPEKALFEISFFYNELTDLIGPKISALTRTYQNFGEITIQGVEPEVKVYLTKNFSMFANATYQEPVEDETTAALIDGMVRGIPEWTANYGITTQIFGQLTIDLLANWHSEIPQPDALRPGYEIDATTIVDLNMNWRTPFAEDLVVSLNVHNLFDEDDEQGGSVPIAYPQKSRWIRASVWKKF